MGVMAIAVGFAMVSYLVSADVGGAGRGIVDRVTRRIPMQSVKIVVVAWQILTQVRGASGRRACAFESSVGLWTEKSRVFCGLVASVKKIA